MHNMVAGGVGKGYTKDCAIPQGCPLGHFYADLGAAAWECLADQFDGIDSFTHLDDRFLIATDDWNDANQSRIQYIIT